MRASKTRLALLIAIGAIGGGAVILLTLISQVGWSATKRQLHETAFTAENAAWPIVSRAGVLLAPGASREERDVWRLIIREYAQGPGARTLPIAVNPVAGWPKHEQEPPSQLAHRIIDGWSPRTGTPEAETAIHDFLAKNTRPVQVDVALPKGSRFVRYEVFERSFSDRFGWEAFSGANHVEAYLTVSRVGFNMFGTRALVYVDVSCGGLCGHGVYYVLEKRGGKWVRSAEQLKWIA
jgi:hypothetical protein